jgi:hypothetical protein
MAPDYRAVIAGTALTLSLVCCGGGGGGGHGGGGNGITGPSTVGTSGAPPAFINEGGHFPGAHPAPVIVGAMVYVYQNTSNPTPSVQASADGLTFSTTPATYPVGVSRTIVPTTDGRFRMYYFADPTAIDVSSAVSSDGLTWTVEPGARYSDPNMGAIRATALPHGGYRLYWPSQAGLVSAYSADGLNFAPEGALGMPGNDSTYTWGPSTVAYVNGQYHMVMTRTPASTGMSELWHAVSADGRNWTVDKSVMAADPGTPLNQPAWAVNGTTTRVYYRAVPSNSVIASGIVRL